MKLLSPPCQPPPCTSTMVPALRSNSGRAISARRVSPPRMAYTVSRVIRIPVSARARDGGPLTLVTTAAVS